MPKIAVRVTIKLRGDDLEGQDVALHVMDAVRHWGGQQPPDYPLHPLNISVRAVCRGEAVHDDDFHTFDYSDD